MRVEWSQVLAAYGLEDAQPEPILMGNINRTYLVKAGDERFILQELNPVFGAEVHRDIEAVTAHLAGKGMLTPRLVRTRSDDLWTVDSNNGVWRLFTYIEGEIISAGATMDHCREAGRLLGAFHVAVADLEHDFCNIRPGVHDTGAHRAHLEEVLDSHRDHGAFNRVAPVGRAILEAMIWSLDDVPPEDLKEAVKHTDVPPRIVHGDPKINNVVFGADGTALCLIDLDTLSRMTIPIELGDAFRSWCNAAGEDQAESTFDPSLFAAGLAGYASSAGSLLSRFEVRAIAPAVEIISLELAARFCADALEESYFLWNREKFPSASAHNLHRAHSQLSLAQSVRAQRPQLREVVDEAFHLNRPRARLAERERPRR